MSMVKELYAVWNAMFWDVESLEMVSPVGPRARMNGCCADVVSMVPSDHVVQFLQTAMT